MANKSKHDFYVPVVRLVVLDNVLFRSGPSSQTLAKNPCSYFIYSEK